MNCSTDKFCPREVCLCENLKKDFNFQQKYFFTISFCHSLMPIFPNLCFLQKRQCLKTLREEEFFFFFLYFFWGARGQVATRLKWWFFLYTALKFGACVSQVNVVRTAHVYHNNYTLCETDAHLVNNLKKGWKFFTPPPSWGGSSSCKTSQAMICFTLLWNIAAHVSNWPNIRVWHCIHEPLDFFQKQNKKQETFQFSPPN